MDSQPTHDALTQPQHRLLVRPWIWLLVAVVVTLATYLPALSGEFVWDDTTLVREQSAAGGQRRLSEYFTQPFWGPTGVSPQQNLYYRPLVVLSYDIDRSIHGFNSAGFRVTNFAFHAINVVLIFLLLRHFYVGGFTAASMSVAWAVLPRLTENVAWISGRTDVLATTGLLSALLLWNDRWHRVLLAVLALSLALLCKETALAGVVVILFVELSQRRSRTPIQSLLRVSCVLVSTLTWLAWKHRVSGIFPSGYAEQSLKTRTLTFFEAIGRYTSMVADWLHPRAEIGVMGEPSTAYAVFGVFMLIIAIGTLLWLWPRVSTWVRALLLGALAAIAPALHVAQLTLDVNAADRFLYIPLVLGVLAFGAYTGTSLVASRVARVTSLVVLVSSVPVTIARAKIWTDPVVLWSDEYRKSGGQCRTCRRELTRIQAEAGDFVSAMRMIQSVIRDTSAQCSTPALAALDLATLFNKLGDHERARRITLQLVAEYPGIPSFWHELAASQAAEYDFAAAEVSANRALTLLPSYRGARTALSLIRRLRADVRLLDDPTTSQLERARFYESCGRIKDAEPLWLSLLARHQSQSEVEEALSFVAAHGSSAAVSTTVEEQAQLLTKFPELAFQIREKRALHLQLAELGILR